MNILATNGLLYQGYKNKLSPTLFLYEDKTNDNVTIQMMFNEYAMTSWEIVPLGYCNGNKLSHLPKENTYGVLFKKINEDKVFWFHVDKRYFDDNCKKYVKALTKKISGGTGIWLEEDVK